MPISGRLSCEIRVLLYQFISMRGAVDVDYVGQTGARSEAAQDDHS